MSELPVLKIDNQMAAQAVRTGTRIGLLCTATSTLEPSSALLRLHAAEQGRTVSIHPLVNAEAYSVMNCERGFPIMRIVHGPLVLSVRPHELAELSRGVSTSAFNNGVSNDMLPSTQSCRLAMCASTSRVNRAFQQR